MCRKVNLVHINELYPPDSEFHETAAIGREIMMEAILDVMDWRDLPDNVIQSMANLCTIQNHMEETHNVKDRKLKYTPT